MANIDLSSENKKSSRPPIITLTENAANRVKELINNRGSQTLGIRVGVKSGGCSGLTYTFEYADQVTHGDESVTDKGVTIFVAPQAVMYIIGTKLDYIDEKVKSGFIFVNPNAKNSCGCGDSFTV